MKLTLLRVINTYMDHTDGFPVSLINDSVEAQQVASIAEKVFYDLQTDIFGNSKLETLVQLDSLADSTRPNYLQLPDDALDIKNDVVMYNIADDLADIKMREMIYITPLEFLDRISDVATKDTTQEVIDFNGYRMRIVNNKAPEFYTSFDDKHLVFDSFDEVVESTLQKSKNGVITTIQKTFIQSETYLIDFPEWFHPTYLNAVMSEASAALREEPLPSITRQARIGIIRARRKQRIGQRLTTIDYGRHSNAQSNNRR